MPRYVYYCDSCNDHFQIRHGMRDKQESCILCDKAGYLTKVPQMPSIKKNTEQKQNTGSLTKDYIEQNRELLQDMKKEARSQEYDS